MSANPRLAHHFADLPQQRETQRVGMWLFLATELLLFGGLWTAYAAFRFSYGAAFEAASGHLSLFIGALNTLVLLASSLTMAMAVRSVRVGRPQVAVGYLAATALLGLTFLGVKAVEYWIDYREELVPGLAFDPDGWSRRGINAGQVQLFLMLYYVMTGLHAVHLVVGIGLLTAVAMLTSRGFFDEQSYMGVELTGLYWHFVDVVWIYLFPLLYLVGTRTAFFGH